MTDTTSHIGKRIPRIEGPSKVTGEALYAADVMVPGMLWGRTLRSPHPHARIVSVNASGARELEGVHAVLTGRDAPPTMVGRMFRDLPLLARDVVRFAGDRVAAVAAESVEIAAAAVELIDVEYEPLPAVFDPVEATSEGAPVLHPDVRSYGYVPDPPPGWPLPHLIPDDVPNVQSYVKWSHGDVEQGFAESDLVFENEYRTPPTHQGYIEPSVSTVRIGEDGRVQVWMTHKNPFPGRAWLAQAIGVPEDDIVFEFVRIGGDFGGKGDLRDAPLAYHLARLTGRPVRFAMDYDEEFAAASTRHGSVIRMKTGVRRDGTLVAHRAEAIFDGGAYAAYKPRPEVHLVGPRHLGGGYRFEHVFMDAACVYTNHVPAGFMRAPGEPQVIFALESHMDAVAGELGLDPYEFRRRNLLADGEPSAAGHRKTGLQFQAVLDAAVDAAGWHEPKPSAPGGGRVGRGLAVSNQKLGTGFSVAVAMLLPGGEVAVRTGVPDAGVGSHTMLRQVAAELLTLPLDAVRILPGSTDESPWDMGLGASRHTYVHGQAVASACAELTGKLKETAAESFGVPPEEVTLERGTFSHPGGDRGLGFADLAGTLAADGPFAVPGRFLHPGDEAGTECFSAQIAEVEVDPETGQVRVLRLTTGNDPGTVINPLMVEGQIEGGVVQGLGYALMEELRIVDGHVTNGSLVDYRIPTAADVPPLTRVLVEDGTGPGPFGARPIAEYTVAATAPAIANAVFDAVGVRITSTPITAEKVWRALHAAESREGRAS
ncbi:xanthine dehydrogenase family protein molybdopterin-binding subunit [Actinomadura sp. SCN-SB]|uniref:xanthine dehydrogenase family protein molybdopterin-binding subunit n=1 Tax=Actinomadura sp. SCN-SB TaxID=3373092 RepID=UPI0037500BD9